MLIKTAKKRKPIPFTAQELMDLHGLTIEQALGAGYPVVGYSQNKKKPPGSGNSVGGKQK